jgi:hypothetical protein
MRRRVVARADLLECCGLCWCRRSLTCPLHQ